jgi:hypothetical protein
MTIAHHIFALTFLLIIISTSITLALTAHYASREIEKIESLLKNSKMVMSDKLTLANAGLLGKIFRLTSISFLLMTPDFFARKGLVDADEIAQLPRKVKNKLKAFGYTYTLLITSFLTSSIFSYFINCKK